MATPNGASPAGTPLGARLARLSTPTSSGCWQWTGHVDRWGYPEIKVGGRRGRRVLAHRVSCEQHIGPIPDGLTLDHLCRNRACVNPHHLEPVTARENLRRGWEARRRQQRSA